MGCQMEKLLAKKDYDFYPKKQAANILNVSLSTILTHRHHIRTKLGLTNKKTNLRSFLKTLT